MAEVGRPGSDEVTPPLTGWWGRMPWIAAAVGLAALVGAAVVGAAEEDHFNTFVSGYLVAYLYGVSLGLGGLFFVLVHHVTRSGWSVVVRRLAEHVAVTLPAMAVLFVPIALGIHQIYHWSHAEAVETDALLQHKAAYLNAPRFLVTAVVVLVAWAAMAWWFRRQSLHQDRTESLVITRRLQTLSAPALVVFAVTLTVASIDWAMSTAPHWYSTVFGVYFFAGVAVAIYALLIVLALSLARSGPLGGVVTYEHLHDLGKLLFAFVVFWAYIAFSQFMLIWYGNIPEETIWYARRWTEGWKPVSIALVFVHFVIPFFVLLLRDIKRHAVTLYVAAGWMLAVHYLDLYWLVIPNVREGGPALHAVDVLSLIGVLGVFAAVLGWAIRGHPLVPLRDPRLEESLAFENV